MIEFWNSVTISVMGQENIVNFDKYDYSKKEVVSGDLSQVMVQHFHAIKADDK